MAALGAACSVTGLLPSSIVLSEGLKKRGNTPMTSAGLVDTWLGDYGHRGVFINAFRNHSIQDLKEAKKVHVTWMTVVPQTERTLQILWKEVVIWKRLSHPNVLPFHGVNMTLFQLALVYDRGERGNIIQYVMSHPEASRTKLVRVTITTVESRPVTNRIFVR